MRNPTDSKALPVHKLELDPRIIPNRIHAIVYSCAILALLYRHLVRLWDAPTVPSFFIFLTMLVADMVLAFMWAMNQGFRWRPVRRQEFPENLPSVISDSEFPKLDVFICTADPYKEPPINVVNTALSVMAFDYPAEKISVYVSDDGGSELTLFAFMEAAKFARHWLPFCKKNKILDRCPEVYFGSNALCPSAELKAMYEMMKTRVERAMESGQVEDVYKAEEEVFKLWRTRGFTRQDHPAVIQPLLQSEWDLDVGGHKLPNLIYLSREKRKTHHHHFKAGALNALLRVSGKMSNAPLILTLDCDMYSNDPGTAIRALCYLVDEEMRDVAYIQFPQRYRGLNKQDIYASEHKRLFQINPLGMDGLQGPNYVGTGCFFRRRALYGSPSSSVQHNGNGSTTTDIGSLGEDAHLLASCSYEDNTSWGHQVGFRYGSLVEDYFTGYRLKCEGWRSLFCNPERASFLGEVPINLADALSQNERWGVGLLEVVFSKYNPLVFGVMKTSLPMGMCYGHYACWPFYALPVTIYGLLPQLSLLAQGPPLFPKASSPFFYLYAYLFLGAYGQDLLDFLNERGTVQRWWSDQRMWMIRGTSSYLFALVHHSFKLIGFSGLGFNLTTKVIDEDENKRYEQGVFEFGAASPFFLSLGTIAMLNIVSFSVGLVRALLLKNVDEVFAQLFVSGFVVVNSWPIYEAMILRSDKGRMPTQITIPSTLMVYVLCCILAAAAFRT
ncbi:cellulose synthase-like protein G3 [Aristolochia californica]|uniref:cellulose synthase-like protein G3 n=1 Tax=Aristolochia californica TaxID=171875 RepID=UPI0035DF8CAC